jgi:hypothetical protein
MPWQIPETTLDVDPTPEELAAIQRRYQRERERKLQRLASGSPSAHARLGRRVYHFPDGLDPERFDGFDAF